MKTTFDDAICPTPTPAGNHQGLSGGYPIEDTGPGGKGLVSSPYHDAIAPTQGGKETRSNELGTTPTLTDVKDAPAGQPSGTSSVELIERHANAGGSTFKTGK